MDVAVVGQVARDLVLLVDELPEAGTSMRVRQRRETLGGRGANQAVSLARLGATVALVGVVGDDDFAARVLDWARADGVDVRAVTRRQGSRTGLIVDVVDAEARWRYFEDLPLPVLLTEEDVAANADVLGAAGAVVVQLRQPAAAALAAVRATRGVVVLDGAPADRDAIADLLAGADVVRADAREAERLVGGPIPDLDAAVRATRALLDKGPRLAALAAGTRGTVFAWRSGEIVLSPADVHVVDAGASDACTAALTLALVRGASPAEAARAATAAVGRPRLSRAIMGT
jgi:ribokinase